MVPLEGPHVKHARIAVVRIAMTMPVMEPELDATVLETWARAIDEGPFSSLCWGERIAFDNPDNLTLLGALAAWTDRVRLLTTVDRAAAARSRSCSPRRWRPATCSAAAG